MAIQQGYYKLLQKYGNSASSLTIDQTIVTYVAVSAGRAIPYGSGNAYFPLFDGGSPVIANIESFLSVYPNLVFYFDNIFKDGNNPESAKFTETRTKVINTAGDVGVTMGYPNFASYLAYRVYAETFGGDDLQTSVGSGNFVYNSVTGEVPFYARISTRSSNSTWTQSVQFTLYNYDSTRDRLYKDVLFVSCTDNGTPYARLEDKGYDTGNLKSVLADMEPIIPPWLDTDPYSPGGNSGTGGGTGTFSDTGDLIGIPSLPTLSAVDTGFISLFNPSAAQIKALANYMWSTNFDLSLFKNIVANPIQCILGLSIVPVDPPDAGTKVLTVGNIPTDVSMPYLSSQYVEVDCGSLDIVEFWGSYLDYSPYTKLSLYLPYIGIVPIDIDDAQNTTVKVVYHVDVLSGACVAYVLCGGTQLYTYIGQCSSNIPITSNDFTNTLNGILGIAGGIGSLVATEGASAPQAIGTIASSAVNALKPNIQKSGVLSGTGGMMGVQTPYLICQRPRQSVPVSQNHFTGYPSNITYTLSDLSGYTEVQNVHLDNVPCLDEEMNEILDLLTGGVVI